MDAAHPDELITKLGCPSSYGAPKRDLRGHNGPKYRFLAISSVWMVSYGLYYGAGVMILAHNNDNKILF